MKCTGELVAAKFAKMFTALKLTELTFIRLLLRIFNVFGIAPLTLVQRGPQKEMRFVSSRLAVLYTYAFIAAIGVSNVMTVDAIYTHRYEKKMSLFHIIDFCEIFLGTFVTTMILCTNCLKNRTFSAIATKMYRINESIGQLSAFEDGSGNKARRGADHCFSIVGLVGFHALLTLIVLSSSAFYQENFVLFVSGATRNFVITWLCLQYAVIVNILQRSFSRINDLLRNLAGGRDAARINNNPVKTIEMKNRYVIKNGHVDETTVPQLIAKASELHYALVRTIGEVTDFYDYTILGAVIYIFVCLVVFSYFILDYIIEKRIFSTVEYVNLFLWIVSFMSAFIALTMYVTKTLNEIDKTGMLVQELIRAKVNNQISIELKNFSSYLLHVKVNFTACGFITLNGSLVQSILGSITTYLVILMQFQLDTSSKMKCQHRNIESP
ncbi:putative gustatory receptor 28b [Trichogramma pretiosum]|uniref:putative gustatory receptor 28b n=1 Tax=Trichogramma pretiosum TaxID=7493 RepID=UPI0006C99830|nr:putative gustatory receptor 28b [Trichogramma pretiosum]